MLINVGNNGGNAAMVSVNRNQQNNFELSPRTQTQGSAQGRIHPGDGLDLGPAENRMDLKITHLLSIYQVPTMSWRTTLSVRTQNE